MKINPAHNEFWYDTNKIVLFYGGKGAGKSFTTALKVINRIVNEEGHRILCIHKYFNKVRDTVYQQFIDIIKSEGLEDIFTMTTSPYKIVCRQNKNEINFLGLDAERIGSVSGITSVWVDEAHFLTEEDWINLVASLGRAKTYKNYFQFILTFNPFGGTRHWLNKRFFKENPYNATIYKTNFSDNLYLSDDYEKILDATKNNIAYYSAAKFGEFADVTDSQVFRNFAKYNIAQHKDISVNIKDYIPIVGLDWGHRHAACALLTATYKDNLIVFDEVYETGLTTGQFISRIMAKQWSKDWIYYCDSANPDKILELNQSGFRNAIGVKKGPGSIAYSIDILLRHNIIILPNCVNLLNEIESYSYKFNEKTSELFNIPADHQQDDAIDALRYSVEGLMDQQPEVKAVMALY